MYLKDKLLQQKQLTGLFSQLSSVQLSQIFLLNLNNLVLEVVRVETSQKNLFKLNLWGQYWWIVLYVSSVLF